VHPPRVAPGGEHVAGFVKAPSNEDLYYQADAYSLK